jgi:hypothetical protein
VTDSNQQHGDEGNEDTEFSRRAVLGAVGAGVGASALPGAVGARVRGQADEGLSGADIIRNRAAGSERDRLHPAGSDFDTGSIPQRLEYKPQCVQPPGRPLYGPTDVNAQTANGSLAVATNPQGTMTVFRWPRPSFYEQLKYFAEERDATNPDDVTVAPNQGAFLGIAADTGNGFETTWLREFDEISQHYRNDIESVAYSDEIVTEYSGTLGLTVTVRTLAARHVDALVRKVEVDRDDGSPVDAAKLVAFENLNLVVGKFPQYPIQDWCLEEDNDHRARYVERLDALVHDRSGVDQSTGEQSSVAVAVGFDSDSVGHHVGGDAYDPAAEPVGREGPARDAYDDAVTGTLSGNDQYVGQATGALATDLSFDGGSATETVIFGAGEDELEAATVLGTARDESFGALRQRKEAWLDDLLGDAPLPDRETIVGTEDEATADAILATARRALISMVTAYDPESGAIVASITTQPPYGEDWPRDGAFFNYVLDLIGKHDWVEKRNRWYANIQQRSADEVTSGDPAVLTDPGQLSSLNTFEGSWNMNYYGDGIPGGPIPFQTDTTGFMVWTMYDHYEVTGDEGYLRSVYPAIRRAAEFMVRCKDPQTGLQCGGFEDDRPTQPQRQTVNGAIPFWQGLKSAAQAARVLGREADAERYEARQHELGRAIDRELYDTESGCYGCGPNGFPYGETTWPLEFTPYADPDAAADAADAEILDTPAVENPYDHPRIQSHLTTDGRGVKELVNVPDNGVTDGGYDAKAIIPLAKARRDEGEDRPLSLVRDSVKWIATRHATEDTHVMGEFWRAYDTNGDGDPDEVRSIQGQPHIWEQTLFYLAALEAFPPKKVDFEPATPESVTGAIQGGASFERDFLSATGERSDDGRFFTAGQTNQVDVTITSLTHGVDEAREVLPAGWEVVATGADVEATTVSVDGDQREAVTFDAGAVSDATAADGTASFTFFVEAPSSSGEYTLGPVEVRAGGTDEDGFVAVSGTTSTEYVLGQSTSF